MLVNDRVDIYKLRLCPTLTTLEELSAQCEVYRVCISFTYPIRQGLEGKNFLVLKERDVKVITDLMMGGDGTNTEGELTDLASQCHMRGDESDDGISVHIHVFHDQ